MLSLFRTYDLGESYCQKEFVLESLIISEEKLGKNNKEDIQKQSKTNSMTKL